MGKMFLLRKSPLRSAPPLSELATALNQDRDVLCSCFTVTLFIFMGRMFHNCSCSGVWQTALGLLVQHVVFSSGRGPGGDDVGTTVLSEAHFLNHFASSEVPMGAWDSWGKRLCACPSRSSAMTTVSWNINMRPSMLRSMRWLPGEGESDEDLDAAANTQPPTRAVSDPSPA